jgi:hypothetical protein
MVVTSDSDLCRELRRYDDISLSRAA